MNIKALITMFVIGSSSAAMASPTFHAQARWSVSTSSTVRDHRADYPKSTPISASSAQLGYTTSHREIAPSLTVQDCSNWDPTLGASNCGRGVAFNTPIENPWTSLGSRDAAMSDHQYITVEQQFRQLRIESDAGAPNLSKVAIRYMDGSVQVVELGTTRCNEGSFGRGDNMISLEHKAISQVVMYTAPGARGVYSVYAI